MSISSRLARAIPRCFGTSLRGQHHALSKNERMTRTSSARPAPGERQARRNLALALSVLAAVLLTLVAVALVTFGIVMRERSPLWRTVAPASELPTSEPARFSVDAQTIFLVPSAGAPLALNARDPYRGCVVAWVAGEQRFVDPCYGSRYLADGSYERGPSPRGLDRFPVRVDGGQVQIDLNHAQNGPAHP